MGLDITAYSHLRHIGEHADDMWRQWCQNEDHVQAFAYDSFPQSFRGIPILTARQPGLIDGGCYQHTADTKTHEFQAGSYSGYNDWRADLQDQFNPETDPDGPFYELIWFADNEGCIGPDAARDLLVDFREHADRYRPGDVWHAQQKYGQWTHACELAADGGLIRFH